MFQSNGSALSGSSEQCYCLLFLTNLTSESANEI
jgi:hypothetical protein